MFAFDYNLKADVTLKELFVAGLLDVFVYLFNSKVKVKAKCRMFIEIANRPLGTDDSQRVQAKRLTITGKK